MRTLIVILLTAFLVAAEKIDTAEVFQGLINQVEKTYSKYQENYNLMTQSSVYSWEMLPLTQFPYQCGKDSLRKALPMYSVNGKDSMIALEWKQP